MNDADRENVVVVVDHFQNQLNIRMTNIIDGLRERAKELAFQALKDDDDSIKDEAKRLLEVRGAWTEARALAQEYFFDASRIIEQEREEEILKTEAEEEDDG